MLAKKLIKKRSKLLLLGLFVFFALSGQILFGTAPKVTLYFMAENFAASVVNDAPKDEAFPFRTSRRVFALWMEQNILSQMYNQDTVSEKEDAKRIGVRLVRLRPALLNQLELHISSPDAPVEMSGFGWCEGMNGVAAILLSHEFDNAELVGLKGPSAVDGDGHVFGRVWSRQVKDWLYFDIWSGEVTVFRSKRGAKARYLYRQVPKGLTSPDAAHLETLTWFHDRAALAITQNELQPTLGGYLWNRIWHYLDHGFTAPASAKELVAVSANTSLPANKDVVPFDNKTSEPQAYALARLDHLLGKLSSAREHYKMVAHIDTEQRHGISKAARLFISRIEASTGIN